MNTRILKRWKTGREEGSALVELALSMPLLCLILLGAAELARIAYAAIEVSNAAHAGAMYASSNTGAVSDVPGITNAAVADAANLGGASTVTVTSITTACTCANTSYTPSSCSDNQTCYQNNTGMVTAVTVHTQSSFAPLINIPGWTPGAMTFNGQSTQVVSNQ